MNAASQAVIEPATHELKAWLHFMDKPSDPWHANRPDDALLSAYFALTNTGLDTMLNNDVEFTALDEPWHVAPDRTGYHDGRIQAREHDKFTAFREVNTRLQHRETPEKGITINTISPRFPHARHVNGDDLPFPDNIPAGVTLHIQSANLDPNEILEVIQAWADAIDVNPEYFHERALADHVYHPEKNQHESFCNVYAAARYVRLDREVSPALVGPGGVIGELANASQHASGKGSHKWDNQKITGYNTRVALTADDWQRLLDRDTETAIRIKHYHPRHVRTHDLEDALANPKLEANLAKALNNGAIPWHRLNIAFDELDQSLHATLREANIPLTPNGPYSPDHHFTPAPSSSTKLVDVPALDLDRVRDVEQAIARDTIFHADLGQKETRVARQLTDGGRRVDELADLADCSSSTVYRALEKLADVVVLENGLAKVADEYIRTELADLFSHLERTAAWTRRRATEIATTLGHYASDTPLARWAQRYGIKLAHRDVQDWQRDVDNELVIRLQDGTFTENDLRRFLRAGVNAARDTGRHAVEDLLDAVVAYTHPEHGHIETYPFARETTRRGDRVLVLGTPELHST